MSSSSNAELKSRAIVCCIQDDRAVNAIDSAIDKIKALYIEEQLEPKKLFLDFLYVYRIYRSTDFEQAAIEFQQILERCEKEGEEQLYSFILLHLGTLYSFLSDYQTSLQYFLRAEESQQYSDQAYQALLHVNISGIYSQILDYSSSANHALKAVNVLRYFKNAPLSVLAYLNLGHSMVHLNEFEDAGHWLYKSLSLAEEIQYDRGIPYAELYTAVLEQKKGNIKQAECFYISSFQAFKVQQDPQGVEECGLLFTQLLLENKRYQEVLDFCDEVEKAPYYQQNILSHFQVFKYKREALTQLGYMDSFQCLIDKQLEFAESKLLALKQRENSYFQSMIDMIKKQKEQLTFESVNEYLDRMSLLGQKLAIADNLYQGVESLFHDIQQIIPATFVGIALYDEKMNVLNYDYLYENQKFLASFSVKCDSVKVLGQYCLKHRESLLLTTASYDEVRGYLDHDPINEEVWVGDDTKESTASVIYVPITLGETLLGVMTVQHMETHQYKPHHLKLVIQLVNFLAVAIKNVQQKQELLAKQKELESINKQLEYISTRDPLTGLNNRHELERLSPDLLSHSYSQSKPLATLMIDVDYYKGFNDLYGHDAGDKVLISIANLLLNHFNRREDYIFRYGGDEILILMKDTHLEEAEKIAIAAQQELFDLNILNEASLVSDRVTLSIGIHSQQCKNIQVENITDYIKAADGALYAGKKSQRNTITLTTNI